MPLAPVALFAYARPDHLARVLATLKLNAEAAQTRLTIFCDAPKRAEHEAGTTAVRALAETVDGFAAVDIVRRDRNFGLAANITDGVGRLVREFGRVIVLEDDLELSPYFLRYMNDALDLYSNEESVASIHAYSYPVDKELPETFFLRGADCWGWGTWARAWARYRPDGKALLAELEARRLTREFDLDGAYPYCDMLRDQIAGRNDSWAIRWHASAFLGGMLTLYPGRSLVHNIGHDDTGTHSGTTDAFTQRVADRPVRVVRQPVEVDHRARSEFARFLRRRQGSLVRRALRAAYHHLRRSM